MTFKLTVATSRDGRKCYWFWISLFVWMGLKPRDQTRHIYSCHIISYIPVLEDYIQKGKVNACTCAWTVNNFVHSVNVFYPTLRFAHWKIKDVKTVFFQVIARFSLLAVKKIIPNAWQKKFEELLYFQMSIHPGISIVVRAPLVFPIMCMLYHSTKMFIIAVTVMQRNSIAPVTYQDYNKPRLNEKL